MSQSLYSTTVPASASSALQSSLVSASAKYSSLVAHKGAIADIVSNSEVIWGAQASLSVIEVQNVMATATQKSVITEAHVMISNLTQSLEALEMTLNVYDIKSLSRPANIIFLAAFTILMAYFSGMCIKSRYHWFNITYVCGYFLEFLGFLGRVLSFSDMTNSNYYIMQLVCLTIAPAFIMGGIYFIFAQLVVIHGRRYSLLKPLWYSYIFIACDVISLVIQAGGGGSASIASQNGTDTKPGTNTMLAGIAFQVVSMSLFFIFWFHFLWQIFFKHTIISGSKEVPILSEKEVASNASHDAVLKGNKFAYFFKFLFSTDETFEYSRRILEPHYNVHMSHVRARKLYRYFPLAITLAVVCIYIRCVYRVVELAMGFDGYLLTHEVYVMCLDALMICFAGIVFVIFHPCWSLGSSNIVKLATISRNKDTLHIEETNDDSEELPDEWQNASEHHITSQ